MATAERDHGVGFEVGDARMKADEHGSQRSSNWMVGDDVGAACDGLERATASRQGTTGWLGRHRQRTEAAVKWKLGDLGRSRSSLPPAFFPFILRVFSSPSILLLSSFRSLLSFFLFVSISHLLLFFFSHPCSTGREVHGQS